MPDFSIQNSAQVSWVDDLLVKDLSGHMKPYHQTQSPSSEAPSVLPSDTALEIAPSHELSTMHVAPSDASFDFFHNGKEHHEPAIFVFHPEDHEQIENLRPQTPIDDSKKYSIEKISQRIIEKNNFIFDADNRKLFDNLLFDFFRNRKNYTITREYLLEKIVSNGHNLLPQAVDHLGSILKGIKERIDAEGGLVVKQADLPQTVKTTEQKSSPKIADDFAPAAVAVAPAMAVESVAKESVSIAKDAAPVIKVRVQPAEETGVDPLAQAPSLPKVRRPDQFVAAKPQVNDVVNKNNLVAEKTAKILTGPVQEIESMSLNNFRRYGSTALERAQKVFQKINILEKDSVSKKAQGIAAWRKSPVYKIYLDLGSASLVKGQEVSQVIAEKKIAGEEVLTIEEFQAISDINKLLRF